MIVKDCYATFTFKDGTEETLFEKGSLMEWGKVWGMESQMIAVDGQRRILDMLKTDWLWLTNYDMRRTSEILRVRFKEVERDLPDLLAKPVTPLT